MLPGEAGRPTGSSGTIRACPFLTDKRTTLRQTPRFNARMPQLTRRRSPDARGECSYVYYGDVHAGTIAIRSGIEVAPRNVGFPFAPECPVRSRPALQGSR